MNNNNFLNLKSNHLNPVREQELNIEQFKLSEKYYNLWELTKYMYNISPPPLVRQAKFSKKFLYPPPLKRQLAWNLNYPPTVEYIEIMN